VGTAGLNEKLGRRQDGALFAAARTDCQAFVREPCRPERVPSFRVAKWRLSSWKLLYKSTRSEASKCVPIVHLESESYLVLLCQKAKPPQRPFLRRRDVDRRSCKGRVSPSALRSRRNREGEQRTRKGKYSRVRAASVLASALPRRCEAPGADHDNWSEASLMRRSPTSSACGTHFGRPLTASSVPTRDLRASRPSRVRTRSFPSLSNQEGGRRSTHR